MQFLMVESALYLQMNIMEHLAVQPCLSIPAPFEPPVRDLRATIPAEQSH